MFKCCQQEGGGTSQPPPAASAAALLPSACVTQLLLLLPTCFVILAHQLQHTLQQGIQQGGVLLGKPGHPCRQAAETGASQWASGCRVRGPALTGTLLHLRLGNACLLRAPPQQATGCTPVLPLRLQETFPESTLAHSPRVEKLRTSTKRSGSSGQRSSSTAQSTQGRRGRCKQNACSCI